MAELIDREELRKFPIRIDHYDKENGSLDFVLGIETVFEYIEYLPTIEAKPVVHAHWKNWGCEGTVCSNCYGRVLYECDEQEKKSKYCPHCGATMDEPISQSHENGVKIPVISMEDVPKLAREMEK